MKRVYFFLISILVLAWTGCSYEDSIKTAVNGSLRITLDIEDIDTGVDSPTRATIPAEENEETVGDVYLLFYDYVPTGEADVSGSWVKTIGPVTGLSLENPLYTIEYDAEITADKDYVILALANLDDYLNGQTIDQFLTTMSTQTEKQALEQTSLLVQGVGTKETGTDFDLEKIDPAKLPMSARVVVEKGKSAATVKLTRGVARFDVEIVPTDYRLVSASIWGAATSTLLWDVTDVNPTERLQRFYGLKAEDFIYNVSPKFRGGLYAFENYVAGPQPTDEVTTCVILGLENEGNTTYYRANVHLAGAPQNLVRNHVYRIKVNSVSGPGENNEYNAWRQNKSQLSYSINEWNLDEGGLVLTDGVNTLVLPAKRVVLDPEGESWYQTVFTRGNGTLRITQNSFAYIDDVDANGNAGGDGIDDIHIFLENNLLRVEAQPLGAGQTERRGMIELSYAGLSGTITYVQAPMANTYLDLDRYDIPEFLSLGRGGITDNSPIEVTASGPWTATIYNTSEDPYNPGFSFSSGTTPVTVLRSANNPYRNLFTVHTTGDNPKNQVRNGFVIVTLDEDPENYQRVVPLTQLSKQGIALTPEQAENVPLRFSGLGVPQGVSNGTKEKGFTFTVDAGRTNGVPHDWTASIATGTDFEVINGDDDPNDDIQSNQFRIVAKENNLTGSPFTGSVRIEINGTTTSRTISMTQGTIGLSLTAKGTEVPKTGGVIEGVTVNIEPEMEWEARILAGSDPDGYLGTTPGTTTATGRGIDKLVAGFPKVYYPQVNVRREIKIEVNIKNSTGSKATLTVTQEPIVPKRMKVMNMRNDHYGSLTGSYFQYYQSYLRYSPLFGSINSKSPMVGGSEMTSLPIAPTNDPSEISTDYVYLHAGGQPGLSYSAKRHNAIYNWWQNFGKNEGILVYVNDEASEALFRTQVFENIRVSYAGAGSGGNNVKLSGDSRTASSSVYDYIMKKGPFGEVGSLNSTLWNDGVSSTAITTNTGSTAIPILWDGANKTILFIDPVNNVVFIGECQVFDIWMNPEGALATTNAGAYPNNSKFLGNLLAYIVNSAQYGSHFSDLFRDQTLYDQQKVLPEWNNPY